MRRSARPTITSGLAVAVDQARKPMRHRGGRQCGGGTPQGARDRPGIGLWRRGRQQLHHHRRRRAPDRRYLHRGGRGARVRARGGRDPSSQEEPAHSGGGARTARRRVAAHLRRIVGAGGRCRSTRPGDAAATWERVAGGPVSAQTLADLEFAWRSCRSVKSNAILLAKDGAAVGIGMGQVNRVDSCQARGRARRS